MRDGPPLHPTQTSRSSLDQRAERSMRLSPSLQRPLPRTHLLALAHTRNPRAGENLRYGL